jgi:hypothetical protein
MIKLSNGRTIEYVVASGALAFDGKGWFWERWLVWLGLMKPELFTTILRTLTRHPRLYPKSNLSWLRFWTWMPFSPWSCVRLITGGAVNKIGLYNKGIEWWCKHVGPYLDYEKYQIVVSMYGTEEELVEMAEMLNDPRFKLTAIEVNPSCPNTGHAMDGADMVISSVKAVKRVSRHPIIVKVAVNQDYLKIARELVGVAEGIDLNSVGWEIVFPNGQRSPLRKLEQRVGGGGGGVSGKPAQKHNWAAVEALAQEDTLPVIAPGIMEFEDIRHVRKLGAKAVSFGAIHLPTTWKLWTLFTNPCKPTKFVQRELASQKQAA